MGGGLSKAPISPAGHNVIIYPDSYNSPTAASKDPPGLTIDILRQKIEHGHIYNITLTSSLNTNLTISVVITQTFINGIVTTTYVNNNPGITIELFPAKNTPVFSIRIGEGSKFTPTGIPELKNKYAVSNDVYTFLYQGEIPFELDFYRDPSLNNCYPVCRGVGKYISPLIFINSQTLIDGSDVGNTIFTVVDNETTIYEKNCPLTVSVLKGKGKTAAEKVENIFLNTTMSLNLYQFGLSMLIYSMLRYILSKLLYGNFNINYLLGKYYKNFLKDLKNSKYNNFLKDFIGPDGKYYKYNEYFLYDKVH